MFRMNVQAMVAPFPRQPYPEGLISRLYPREMQDDSFLMRQFFKTNSNDGIFLTCRTCHHNDRNVRFLDDQVSLFLQHLEYHGIFIPKQTQTQNQGSFSTSGASTSHVQYDEPPPINPQNQYLVTPSNYSSIYAQPVQGAAPLSHPRDLNPPMPHRVAKSGHSHAHPKDSGFKKANVAIEGLQERVASCEKMEGACMDNVVQQESKIRELQQINIDQRQKISLLASQVDSLVRELQVQRDSQRFLMEKWGKKAEMDTQCIEDLHKMQAAAEKIHIERLEILSKSTATRMENLGAIIQGQQAQLDSFAHKQNETQRHQKRKLDELEDDQIVILGELKKQDRKLAKLRQT